MNFFNIINKKVDFGTMIDALNFSMTSFMTRALFNFIFYLFFLLFLHHNSVKAQALNYKQGELILWLEKGVLCKQFISKQLYARNRSNERIEAKTLNSDWNIHLISFDFTQTSEDDLLKSFKRLEEVHMVQKNHLLYERRTPNDTYFNRQWQFLNDGSIGGISGADFRANKAWDLTTGGLTEENDTIVVCVIDGGLEYAHGDLKSNIWYNRAEIAGNNLDDDNNGYIDDFRGWNSYTNNDSVIVNNHGTEVCGVIGAIGNNRLGVCGVNWAVKIMMVQGGADEASAVSSYSYPWRMRKEYNLSGGKKGAFVVSTNSSWGRNYGRPEEAPIWCAMYDSLGSVGILNATSTTNLDINVDVEGDLPTNCESEFLIGVTNINWNDNKVNRAGYGIKSIDIGAYGEEIFTTTTPNTFGWFNGTSAAAPEVAGAIALMYSLPCNNLVRLAKTNPQNAALFAKDILLQQGRKLMSLEKFVKTSSVLNLQDVVYAIHSIHAESSNAQISFQSTIVPLLPLTLQYRLLGSSDWNEIQINNKDPYVIDNLSKCETYEFRILGGCERYKSEYSKIQRISTKGCCVAPEKIELMEVSNDFIVLQFKGIENNSNFLYVVKDSDSEITDTFSIVNLTDPILSVNGLKKCSKYTVQLINNCGDRYSNPSAEIEFRTSGCDQCDDKDYCKRTRPSADLEWLESIEIDGEYFVSENNFGYGDFIGSSHTWNLAKSTSHTISLIPGYSTDSSLVYLAAWIDFNHNSIFENAENVLPVNYKSKAESKFVFTIPANARTGITRIRVIAKYAENGVTPPAPCFNGVEFGEYEDYCIGIVENSCSPVIKIDELSRNSTGLTYFITKSSTTDIIAYQYRKMPFGIWQEGRIFNNTLNLIKLDSCAFYEMTIRNECDFINSKEVFFNFNTLSNNCLVNTNNTIKYDWQIYPNPFNNYLTVSTALGDVERIRIYELSGRLVKLMNGEALKAKKKIELNDLNPGIYLLECLLSNGEKVVRKITKI